MGKPLSTDRSREQPRPAAAVPSWPTWAQFSSGVALFCPESLKFYPAVGFYFSAKSIHDQGGRRCDARSSFACQL